MVRRVLLWTILIAGVSTTARADDDVYEKKIRAELEAMAPNALEAFDRANAARAANDAEGMVQGYDEVQRLAPKFSHAHRRRCNAEYMLGRRDEAITHCRAAHVIAPLPENKVGLAAVLAYQPDDLPAPYADKDEADRLVEEAVVLAPDNHYAQLMRCQLAAPKPNLPRLAECSARLIAIQPDDAYGYYFASIEAALREDFLAADDLLAQARERGMPDEAAAGMQAAIDNATPTHLLAWKWTKLIGVPWAIGLAVLIALGFVLSSMTLAAAKRTSTVQSGQVSGLDATLRKLYRAVLWLCCAYYYVSLPLVLIAIVASAGGAIYGFFALGRIPIKLVAIIAIIALGSIAAVIKGVLATFTSGSHEDPGEKLDLAEHPRLRAALEEVAGKVGTRPVDAVFLEVDATIAVMERGGMLDQMRHKSERCLILGVAALDGMKTDELKAILAHEYGHFQNEDTAGGGFALAVRRSMIVMAIELAKAGAATWYNPAWLFFRGFYWVFMRVSQGASRLQEILADRWAALAYGSDAFSRGLKHAIRRAVEFDAHVGASFEDVMERRLAVANLYTYEPTKPIEGQAVNEAVDEVWNRPPSPLDSHPCPRDRIEWVSALNVPSPRGPDSETLAWELLSNREAVEMMMTNTVRNNVLVNHGVDIHKPPAAE